jgi:Tfp pilus assembly protein PilE
MILLLILAGGYRAWSDDTAQTKPALAKQLLLEVVNESGKSFTFSTADLAKLPQKEIEARDQKGDQAKYSGVLLASVLAQADVTLTARRLGHPPTTMYKVDRCGTVTINESERSDAETPTPGHGLLLAESTRHCSFFDLVSSVRSIGVLAAAGCRRTFTVRAIGRGQY